MTHRVGASIRTDRLSDILEALDEAGLHEVVVTQAKGFTGSGTSGLYRGVAYQSLGERVLLDVIVESDTAEMVATLISVNARTGRPGDGSVWSHPLDITIDVSTGRQLAGPA